MPTKTTNVRIRVQGTSFNEVLAMAQRLEKIFPTLMFSVPREGRNPKYAGNQMWASYSRYRVKNGKELPISI